MVLAVIGIKIRDAPVEPLVGDADHGKLDLCPAHYLIAELQCEQSVSTPVFTVDQELPVVIDNTPVRCHDPVFIKVRDLNE